MPATSRTVLRNVSVFDGRERLGPRDVVIDGPVIGRDATAAREIDATGATVLPGLIDSHVHVHDPDDLARLASWGVTTGLDMGCWPNELVTTLRAATDGVADFRTAGLPAIGPGGQHARLPGMPAEAVVTTVDAARRFVDARVAEGVDYVKGVAEAPGDGGPPAEVLRALVRAALAHGLGTVIHAASVGAYTVAVESGARFVTHEPVLGVVRPEDAAAMRSAGQVAVPTITMMEGVLAARFGRHDIANLIESFAVLRAAEVEILAGTDANAAPGAPSQVAHGSSLHHEFDLMARAGMPPIEILRAATSRPAELFGLTDRGVLAAGARADLLLVDGDPTVDVSTLRSIRGVWCNGREVPRDRNPS